MFTSFAPIRQPCACAAPAQAGQKAVLKGQPGDPAAGYRRLAVPVARMTLPALTNVNDGVSPETVQREHAGNALFVAHEIHGGMVVHDGHADLFGLPGEGFLLVVPSYLSQMRGRSG